jgi:hypothetical protein
LENTPPPSEGGGGQENIYIGKYFPSFWGGKGYPQNVAGDWGDMKWGREKTEKFVQTKRNDKGKIRIKRVNICKKIKYILMRS